MSEPIIEGRNLESEIDIHEARIRALEAQLKDLQEALLLLQQKVTG